MSQENGHPMFINIATGMYSFIKKDIGQMGYSHCIYGLAENGEVYKFVPKEHRWFPLEELRETGYDDDFDINFKAFDHKYEKKY